MRGPDQAWQGDLWDAYPQFSDNVLQTVGWLQKYVRVSYGLHKLNKDYGKGLAKLVKKENKSGDDGCSISVSHKACLSQLTVLAGKHKQIAVSLGNLSKEYETHIKRLLDQHKCVENEAKKLQSDLDNSIKKLDRSRDKYEKRQHEADDAEDHLNKSEPDSRVSRAELEKIKDVADDTKARAIRARDEYGVQLNLTNSYQRGFYQETWPNVFSKLRRLGQEAEEGVNDLLSRVVSGGLDQWPEPVEAWGELDNCRELLDFKGDFSSFTILTKSGNPCPQDFTFVEPRSVRDDVWSSPRSRFGSLRRTISRQSLRYRSGTLQRSSGKFSSMFSLRANSSKMTRKVLKTEVNSGNKSFDSIDKIDEETASRKQSADVSQEMKFITAKISSYTRESSASDKSYETNDISVDLEPDIKYPLRTSTPIKSKFNPFQETNGHLSNGFHETHFDVDIKKCKNEGLEISKYILDEVLSDITGGDVADNSDQNNEDTDDDYVKYDDRKNPFMDEVYDDSLVFA